MLKLEITKSGEELKEQAIDISYKVGESIGLQPEDAREMYRLLHVILEKISK